MENRYVDWSKAFDNGEWQCLGREIMEERKGSWSNDNPEGLESDDYVPIYNYAYPLDLRSLDEDKVVKICDETNCTVVLNCEDDLLYVALCGCGMNYSQDIALAYMIAYSHEGQEYGIIPRHLLFDVCKSEALSVSHEKFDIIREKLSEGFEKLKASCDQELEILKRYC